MCEFEPELNAAAPKVAATLGSNQRKSEFEPELKVVAAKVAAIEARYM